MQNRTYPVIILGHRGEGPTNANASVYKKNLDKRKDTYYENQILPENSLSSFASALRHGADGVECDVHISKDGIPMVIHDNLIARNADGYHCWGKEQKEDCLGHISNFTANELKKKFTIGNNETIPTLNELIQLMIQHNKNYNAKTERNLTLNIELKGDKAIVDATYKVVCEFIKNKNCSLTLNDFLFSSFDEDHITALKKCNPKMRCTLTIPTKQLFSGDLSMPGWVPSSENYTKETMQLLENKIDNLQLSGLDLMSADIHEEIVALCAKKQISINATTHPLRLRMEAEKKHSSEEKLTDIAREKCLLTKLAKLSNQYKTTLYYKTDYPGMMKAHLENLEWTATEKQQAKKDLSLVKNKYHPSLFASLRHRLAEFHEINPHEPSSSLIKTYIEALDEFHEEKGNTVKPRTMLPSRDR